MFQREGVDMIFDNTICQQMQLVSLYYTQYNLYCIENVYCNENNSVYCNENNLFNRMQLGSSAIDFRKYYISPKVYYICLLTKIAFHQDRRFNIFFYSRATKNTTFFNVRNKCRKLGTS